MRALSCIKELSSFNLHKFTAQAHKPTAENTEILPKHTNNPNKPNNNPNNNNLSLMSVISLKIRMYEPNR